jgi:hypothetical protein
MIQQLLFALALTCMTVVLHAAGTVYVVIPMTLLWKQKGTSSAIQQPVRTLVRLASSLLILHLLEMAVWATAYSAGGVLPNFEAALYYSLTSYSSVGYGDVIPPVSWRLLGPIEATVGILMLGWSTSIVVAAVQKMYNPRLPNAS